MKYRALSNSYLSAFCLELSIILQSGATASDGILMIQDDESDRDGKVVLQSILDALENGASLSSALSESGYFPHYLIHMTEIGEQTGRLAETLKALAEHYDRQDRLALSIKNAVLYPAILLVIMIAVLFILIIQVLPIFNDVFHQLGSQMPPLALHLMQFGKWLGGASTTIAIVLCLFLVIAFVSWLIPQIREILLTTFNQKWGHRGLLGKISSLRFASALSLALTSGLDAQRAVEMASAVSSGAKQINEKHRICREILASGSTLSEAICGSDIFSARDCRMLSLGSRSGTIDTTLAEIVHRNNRNVQDEMDRIVGKIEPTLVIITSVIVGVILLSVMLPLMGILTSIG